ncbi:MAG: FeoA family protein [Anaerolineae bacterium]
MSEARSLLQLSPGQSGVVVGFDAGHGLMCRLAAMGFTPGSRLTVLNNYGRGPLLVMVHGSRIALGRGEAARVLVRPE